MNSINGKPINEIIKLMSLEEKASLCSGKNFWQLQDLSRLGIPAVMVTDGPHGLRKQQGESDHVGLADSVPATCFPTAVTLASSWDTDLLGEVGIALGNECRKEDVAVLLGPGVNIKRSPLCGRNFEYFSEDPFLSGKLAAAFIEGVQSRGVGTSIKHFAGNNQEYNRQVGNSVIDERTLREIYLPSFETAVKKAQPWTVMCSYNKLNGSYLSENSRLLNDILRNEWGFRGLVVTDWGAANDRVKGLKAGLDLEMPGSGGLNDARIVKAVESGSLDVSVLDKTLEKLLGMIAAALPGIQGNDSCDMEEHHKLAGRAAEESIVLLKNNDNCLPLKRKGRITVIGEFAETPRYQGNGSSLINPWKLESFIDEIKAEVSDDLEVNYAAGWRTDDSSADEQLVSEAVAAAETADYVIFFAGLPPAYESEGFDRSHLRIPEKQIKLIAKLRKTGKKLIIVLQNGAPVEMPWLEECDALIENYLGGQAGAGAVKRILFGDVNPSGKLAETFPVKLEDCASSAFFRGAPRQVEYRESLYVGYRWFDSAAAEVLFPFGHGLSYTSFEYGPIQLSAESITAGDELTVSLSIKNTGSREGAEVVQLYVRDCESTAFRPEKELKDFSKLRLKPDESREVIFTLDKRSFAYYDVRSSDWQIESGDFDILAGASSRDIRQSARIKLESEFVPSPADTAALSCWYNPSSDNFQPSDKQFAALLGHPVPVPMSEQPYHINSTISEIRKNLIGRLVYSQIKKNMLKNFYADNKPDEATENLMEHMIEEMPLRTLVLMGGGMINFKQMEGLINILNGKLLRGLLQLIKGF